MKNLFTIALAATIMLAAGCMKIDNNIPDHIAWGTQAAYYPTTSFVTDPIGDRSVVFSAGSRNDYENPEKANETLWFAQLTLNLGQPEQESWAREYKLAAPLMGSAGRFELGVRYLNDYGEITSEDYSVPVISGTLTIEHIKDDTYKVSFSGTGISDDIYTLNLSAETENSVKFVTPE